MKTKVFLSLSHVDQQYVSRVAARLPKGLAYFYERSFENGEHLLEAMERSLDDASIFVLFSSHDSAESPWVKFEIDRARLNKIKRESRKILVFPITPNASPSILPEWMRQYWIPKAGWRPSDIARYITTLLLQPDVGLSQGSVRVVGRGRSLDRLEQITAENIARSGRSPNVYVISGFTGVGRRTFAAYYMRRSLSADANLVYGPVLVLSPQADLQDLYRSLRSEIADDLTPEKMGKDLLVFQEAAFTQQISEINRLIDHFSKLGQAITLLTTGGLFEDRGYPKDWVMPLLGSIPQSAMIILISNRRFPFEIIESTENMVQIHLDELEDDDIRALMIFSAERLRITNFDISPQLVRAIGGHADVANAAVRLVASKGAHILERSPDQLFNIQDTILGENVRDDALTMVETRILNVLSWVPALGGNILEKTIVGHDDIGQYELIDALENLILGCMVTASGFVYRISPSIRMLFRRWHVSPPDLLKRFAEVLSSEWESAVAGGNFRLDLFEAFVFMHALEGMALPNELRTLLSPGTLYDVLRESYARGKDSDDPEELRRVISWGEIANEMRMSEATREEIQSIVVRANIRLGHKLINGIPILGEG